jgi:O-antigen ligase
MKSMRLYLESNYFSIGLLLFLFVLQIFSVYFSFPTIFASVIYLIYLFLLNSNIRPFALLMTGGIVLTPVTYSYGISAGMVAAIFVFILLLFKYKNIFFLFKNIKYEVFFFSLILNAWWIISWYFGPRTDYSKILIMTMIINMFLGTISFSLCFFGNMKKNLFKVAMLCMIAISIESCISSQNIPIALGSWHNSAVIEGIGAMPWMRTLVFALIIIIAYCIQNVQFMIGMFFSSILCSSIPLYASDTRQAYIGLIIGLCGFLVYKNFRKRALMILSIVFIASSLVFINGYTSGYKRYENMVDSQKNIFSRAGRFDQFDMGYRIWQKSPLLGIGLGGVENYTSVINTFTKSSYPHNLFLEMLAETGIIGFCTGLGFLILCISQIYLYKNIYFIYWEPIFPAWLYLCAISMISGDIRNNIFIFIIPLSIILFSRNKALFTTLSNKLF